MKYNSLVQLGLIVISITIIFTYIQPTFADIRLVQDELFEYTDAVEKAGEFNQRLNELASVASSISEQDMARLNRLLPENVDSAQVMRDLEVLVERSELTLASLEADEEFAPSLPEDFQANEQQLTLSYQDFMLAVEGSYEDIKRLFNDIEGNDYLLEIIKLEFGQMGAEFSGSGAGGGANRNDFKMEATLRVYAQHNVSANQPE